MSTGSKVPEPRTGSRVGVHLLLYLLTCLTTTAAGALYVNHVSLFPLQAGLAFSIPLMAILTFHEFGHYIAARLHGVPASLPYFIPMPPPFFPFGTMGAVITQSGTTDRKKLIDIGAAGPLAGLVVAVPVLIYGLQQSQVTAIPAEGVQEGNSILYLGLKFLIKGAWLPSGGRDVMLHPTAFAGWAGLLVTMLNLLPIGQLDGGHVATAYFGNGYGRVARLVHRALPWLALVVFAWVSWSASREIDALPVPTDDNPVLIALPAALSWVFFYVLLSALGRLSGGLDHPPVDDQPPLSGSRRLLFWVVAAVLVLIFMPVVMRESIGPPEPDKAASAPAR
jgi:membrane-associated protease RseP (regulator of RpoE activity)